MGFRFQWVKCQLDTLGRCLSLSDLRKALRSLPKDLDDTYARILQSIEDDGNGHHVAKLMQWLAYSARPMSITEIAEVITVDAEDDPLVDVERRLEDPYDLLTICSSLVTTVRQQATWDSLNPSGDEDLLQFAHFSILEYLESSRIRNGPTEKFAIQWIRANALIAKSCITYSLHFDLLQTDLESLSGPQIKMEYPLVKYAARYWYYHVVCAEEGSSIVPLYKAFLMSEGHPFSMWREPGDWNYQSCMDAQGKCVPLLYASVLRLPKVTSSLSMEGADVNPRSKYGSTPLMAASMNRHTPIDLDQLLLDHGAEVNAQDDRGCTALISAASEGNVQAVGTVLDNGADIDAHDEHYQTAMTMAPKHRLYKIVRQLLEKGACVNSPGSVKALMFTVEYGRLKASRMFLEQGNSEIPLFSGAASDARPTGWLFNTNLLQKLRYSHHRVANLLLKYGADVNARSTIKVLRGVALQHAKNHGGDHIVKYLLEHGADPSLFRPENLGESGMDRYGEILLIQSQRQPLGVQEEEAQEPEADV